MTLVFCSVYGKGICMKWTTFENIKKKPTIIQVKTVDDFIYYYYYWHKTIVVLGRECILYDSFSL